MTNNTPNDKYKELTLLRKERISKAKDLYKFVEELRTEMSENGQMLPNKEFDPIAGAIEYAKMLEMKTNFDKEGKGTLNKEKYEIIVRAMDNMKDELAHISNNSYEHCDFEEFVKNNLKYLDLSKIEEEVQNFNPFTYDMRNELFYTCFTHLNEVRPMCVREENKLFYEELIKNFISIQSTIVKLLDVRLQIEKEEREKVLEAEEKISPSEALYIENYMNILKEKLGLFILNTMKQNMIILSQKLYYSEVNEEILAKLFEEFGALYEDAIIYISTYDAEQSLRALPENYADSILPQIELIKTFILTKEEERYKR
ncbi:MAG: hypothetical protein R3Y13_01035 [bacterium]